MNAMPWLAPALQSMARARAQQRVPHAVLVHEAPGAGGGALALQIAQLLLCRASTPACGVCRDCQWTLARAHPDLYWLKLEEDASQIKVEQVRDLLGELQLTSHEGGATVAIVDPAHALNAHAANALLKTLEEPARAVTLILVTHSPGTLPATVRSRCLRLMLPTPARAESLAWLRAERGAGDWERVLGILGNAPALAAGSEPHILLRLHADTLEQLAAAREGRADVPGVAERWGRGEDWPLRLRCIENWVTSAMLGRLGLRTAAVELQTATQLRQDAGALNIRNLIRLHELVREMSRTLASPLNKALAIEQMLWRVRSVADT